MKLLSIVIPLYNDGDTLEDFYYQMNKALKTMQGNYECIFIDNASRDKTRTQLQRICEHDFHIHYVSLLYNVSTIEAYYIGLRYTQGDFILIMDLKHPAYMIKEFFHIMNGRTLSCAGGNLMNPQKHSQQKQRYFKIFQAKLLQDFVMEEDFDGFKSYIKHTQEDILWISYSDLEQQEYSQFHYIMSWLNARFEQRMIYIVLFSFVLTIIMIPSVLMWYFHLDFLYSFYISTLLTLCVLIVMLIVHARFCCYYMRNKHSNIKETTFH